MTIALVQSVALTFPAPANPVATLSSTLAGSLIVVTYGCNGGGGAHLITAVTDNQSNTYLHQAGFVDNNGSQTTDVWYSENSTAGVTSVTITVDPNGFFSSGFVQEYSGVKSSSSLDVFGTNAGTTPPSSDGPILNPSQNGELLLTFFTINDSATFSVNSPWSVLQTNVFGLASLIQTTAGSAQAMITQPFGGGGYASTGITFLPIPVPPITLTLTDSLSSNDSSTKEDEKVITDSITPSDSIGLARGQNVTDSVAVADSISAQSSFTTPVHVPSVEVLVNQLVPADTKTYFTIQE